MNDEKIAAVLVSETHWDRAWYLPFQQFRLKLVRLVDNLLAILESDPSFTYFTFDGQTIVLEDYLEVKPQNRERLKKLIQAGRVIIGPWYVLPDEFLISGEALIRNLRMGNKVGKEFGPVMRVGYIPDSFGHVSQIPQILTRFGIDSAIFARGTGYEVESLGAEFIWRASDDSEVLTHWLPLSYGNAADLPPDPEDAASVLEEVLEELRPFSRIGIMLLMNGSDHLEPQRQVPEAIRIFNDSHKQQIVMGTLPQFVNHLRAKRSELKNFRGEFRRSKHQNLLSGVYSARVYLKQANEKAQNALERWVEPWSAVAYLQGARYPRDEIHQAWKYLLRNHPHDDICGCSIDEVHDDMMQRFRWIDEMTDPLISQALDHLAGTSSKPHPGFIVCNPTPQTRSGVATVTVLMSDLRFTRYAVIQLENPQLVARDPLEAAKNEIHIATVKRWGLDMTPTAERELQIGSEKITEFEFDFSGFALMVPAFEKFKRHVSPVYRVRVNSKNQIVEVWGRKYDAEPVISGGIIVKDQDGEVVPAEVIEVTHRANPKTRMVADLEEHITLAVYAKEVKGLGFRRYDLEIEKEKQEPGDIQYQVTCNDEVLENGLIELRVEDNGTVTLRDLESGEIYEGLLEFEDTEDVGDSYDYCPAVESTSIRAAGVSELQVSVEHNTLVGMLRVDGVFLLPESATSDSLRRTDSLVECEFSHELRIYAGSKVVHVTTTFNNEARDHRLRVLFPSMTGTTTSHADSAFDVIERPARPHLTRDWKQPPAPTCPLRSFVSLNAGSRGLTIATKGLLEFELLEERGGTIAITLLRAFGWLSRITLETRPEAAGPIIETPGGQCPGTHSFEYAIIPHSGDWLESSAHVEVDKYLNQMTGVFVPKSEEEKEEHSGGFLSIWPETIKLSALKLAEDSDRLLLRVWNISDKTELCTLKFGFPIRDVVSVRLDESQDESIEVSIAPENTIALNIAGRKIITLLITPQ